MNLTMGPLKLLRVAGASPNLTTLRTTCIFDGEVLPQMRGRRVSSYVETGG